MKKGLAHEIRFTALSILAAAVAFRLPERRIRCRFAAVGYPAECRQARTGRSPVPPDAMRSRLDGYGCQRLPTADNRFQCHLITRYGRKTGGEVRSVQTVVLQQQQNGAWQPIAP